MHSEQTKTQLENWVTMVIELYDSKLTVQSKVDWEHQLYNQLYHRQDLEIEGYGMEDGGFCLNLNNNPQDQFLSFIIGEEGRICFIIAEHQGIQLCGYSKEDVISQELLDWLISAAPFRKLPRYPYEWHDKGDKS